MNSRSIRIALALIGLILVVSLSLMKVIDIQIVGNDHSTKEEILEMINIKEGQSLLRRWYSPPKSIKDMGYVDYVTITYPAYNRIKVDVTEKEIIGYVDYMGKYLCVDLDGYIIDYTEEAKEGKPVISGINIVGFTLYSPIELSDNIIRSIDAIYNTSKSFGIPLDKIDFKYGQGQHINLLYDHITIQLGDVSNIEEKFQTISDVLEQLPEDKVGVLIVEDVDKHVIFRDGSDGE